MNSIPIWKIPDDLDERLEADTGGMWEDNQWSPILLTIMKGTSYKGREIPLAWQIEFEPGDESCEAANIKIRNLGVEPDGYGWANFLSSVVEKYYSEILDQLQFGDTDIETCVVWVELEETCKVLIQLAWSLIHKP